MPEVSIKELRLPELHLPEISRDDIRRSLSEIHLPEVDLSRMERPRIDLPSIDVGKAIAGVAAAAHLTRPARRSRLQPVLGALIVAGLAGWAVLSNAALRARIGKAVEGLRQRVDSMRAGSVEGMEVDADRTVAFPAAETKPAVASPYADAVIDSNGSNGSAGNPDGLGAGDSDRIPAFEESTNS